MQSWRSRLPVRNTRKFEKHCFRSIHKYNIYYQISPLSICSTHIATMRSDFKSHDIYCEARWFIGGFNVFRPKCCGFESCSDRPRRDIGQVLHSQLPVALRCETPTKYPCCVGSAYE